LRLVHFLLSVFDGGNVTELRIVASYSLHERIIELLNFVIPGWSYHAIEWIITLKRLYLRFIYIFSTISLGWSNWVEMRMITLDRLNLRGILIYIIFYKIILRGFVEVWLVFFERFHH
jgi:hypothetical protein